MKLQKVLAGSVFLVLLMLWFSAFSGTSKGSPLTGNTPVVPGPGESWAASAQSTGTDDASGIVETSTVLKLKNTQAQVSAYRRGGEIKRLYGAAFSFGPNPQGSAESFLQSNAQLLGWDFSDLSDQNLQPVMYDPATGGYKFMAVSYSQKKDEIPVYGSKLILLVRNEAGYPLVLASSSLRSLGDFQSTVKGSMNSALGIANAQRLTPGVVNFSDPQTVIWAGIEDIKATPVVAYSFTGDNYGVANAEQPERYRYVVNSQTGELLYIENLIVFVDVTGKVEGKATQGKAADFCEEELAEGMPWARAAIGSMVAYGDSLGNFVISNSGSTQVIVSSGLVGRWFTVNNQAGTNEVLYDTIIPPGPANFMHNPLNLDEFIRAQTNGYLQANVVRDFTIKYNPAYPGLQQNQFPVKVNDNTGYCPGNAWYDGSSITFCRTGGSYPNTAFSTVIHHEYGHHLVAMAGSGQDQYGEGMGDVMGLLITDDPGTGYGFYGTGTCSQPLRTANNTMQYPCTSDIHTCAQLLSGCVWSTRNALVVTNPSTYLDILGNLAVNAMLLHTGGTIDPSITIDYLTLDDDNGNINDGTPHYSEIATGFGAHNMDAPELSLLAYSFPNGLPELILPSGGTAVRVVVTAVSQQPQPGTGVLFFNSGSGWTQIPMTQVENNVYDAVFPGADCGTQISYYFKTQTTGGQYQSYPSTAPGEVLHVVAATGVQTKFADNFNTDKFWTVQNGTGLTTGAWQRGIPAGDGTRCDPVADFDGSGYCYVTDNRYGDYDIDGGTTWLLSPTLDLSQVNDAVVSYAIWYQNDCGADPNNDLFKVYVSNNNGTNWTLVQTIGPASLGNWTEYSFSVSDFTTPTNQVKVIFEASDLNSGSVVEAGVDAYDVKVYECGPARGDMNADKIIDVADVIYLINYLYKSGPEPNCTPIASCGDANKDTIVDVADVIYLINYLFKSGPPPNK